MIIENTGNMITSVKPKFGTLIALVHGCNAQGRMGSGIALEIRNTYPEAYEKYNTQYTNSGLSLGESVVWTPSNPENETFQIWNMITQEFYRGFKHSNGLIEPHDKVFVDYDAVKKGFTDLNNEVLNWAGLNYIYYPGTDKEITTEIKDIEVHFPKIGAGLANGDWNTIQEIIDSSLDQDIKKNLWVL